ncbi:MAG TPA: hypothetical protein VJ852_09795 [Gemmatimonadaceae bacterium]|nr:hypothetical protein [Gemmatimonadaceae bacterium]
MRQTKILLSVIAVMAIAACTDNSVNGPYGDVSGTYQLTVFAGRTLPATYTYQAGQVQALPNGGTIQWTDGTMVLNSNGTFVETNNYVATDNLNGSQSGSFISTGTYTVSGVNFTLSAPPQNSVGQRYATGTIQFDTINYDEDNGDGTTSSYEYKR